MATKRKTWGYMLQIPIPPEMREALREVTHAERKELQELVPEWLLEKLKTHPASRKLVRKVTLDGAQP